MDLRRLVGGLLVLSACNIGPSIEDDGTVCADARNLLRGCGVKLAFVETQDCAGASRAVAQCVVDHADSCESLTTIRFDECLMDAADTAGEPTPFDPIPVDPTQGLPDGTDPELPPDAAPEEDDETCSDGLDNDVDGFVDCLDVGCSQNPDVTVCETADTDA